MYCPDVGQRGQQQTPEQSFHTLPSVEATDSGKCSHDANYPMGCSTDSSCLVRTQGRDSSSQKGSKTYTAGRGCQRMRSEEYGEIFISSKGSMDFMGGVRSPYLTVRTQYLSLFCSSVLSTTWEHPDAPPTRNRPSANVEPDSCIVLKATFFINYQILRVLL